MDFEISADARDLKETAIKFLNDKCPSFSVQELIDEPDKFPLELWREMALMGWMGVAIEEEYGGSNLGLEGAAVLAEALGMVASPMPYCASIMASDCIDRMGSKEIRDNWLPKFASGQSIGTILTSFNHSKRFSLDYRSGRVRGSTGPILDAFHANTAVARVFSEKKKPVYLLIDLDQAGIEKTLLPSIDGSRPVCEIIFDDAAASELSAERDNGMQERLAILYAFEQIGSALGALQSARKYAIEREAFGHSIASFQAIQHKLVDMYVKQEIARSNGYFGLYAIQHSEADLQEAACLAQLSASDALEWSSKEAIQIYGGMGFTIEVDSHLFYRRACHLGVLMGGKNFWKNKLFNFVLNNDQYKD